MTDKILNDAHPLVVEGVVYALIGVNSSNEVYDYVTPSRSFTPDAGVTFGTGTYGRHFKTDATNENVDMDPIGFTTTLYPNQTKMMVCNNVTGENSRGLAQGGGVNTMGFAYDGSTGQIGITRVATTSGIDVRSTGSVAGTAFSVVGIRQGGTDAHLYVNGSFEASKGSVLGANGSGNSDSQLGAYAGQGSMFAEYVYYIYFTRQLTAQEIEDLHNSLGADNAFGLLVDGAAPLVFSGTVDDQTINVTEAIPTIDISANITGGTTPYSYTVQAGTLPQGLTLNSATGAITGVNTDGVSQTGIVIRVTDADSATVDTNAFDITVDTSLWGVLGSDIMTTGKNGGSLLAPSLSSPADDNNRYRFVNLVKPTTLGAGRFEMFEDFSAVILDAPDGIHTGSFEVEENGTNIGTVNFSMSVGVVANVANVLFNGLQPTFSAASSITTPTNSAAVLFNGLQPIFAVAGGKTDPQFNAAVTFNGLQPTFSVAATSAAPGSFTASVLFNGLQPTFSVAAAHTVPEFDAAVSFNGLQPTFSANALNQAAGFYAAVSFNGLQPTFSVAASRTIPDYTATVTFNGLQPMFSVNAVNGDIVTAILDETNINLPKLSTNIKL